MLNEVLRWEAVFRQHTEILRDASHMPESEREHFAPLVQKSALTSLFPRHITLILVLLSFLR